MSKLPAKCLHSTRVVVELSSERPLTQKQAACMVSAIVNCAQPQLRGSAKQRESEAIQQS